MGIFKKQTIIIMYISGRGNDNDNDNDSDSDSDSDIEQYDGNSDYMFETLSVSSSDNDDEIINLDDNSSDSESIIIDDINNNNNNNSDSDSDSEPEFIQEIFHEDSTHLYMDKEDKQYYVGFCKPMHKPHLILMANSVSTQTFFRHPFERICQYLQHYSTLLLRSPKLEIMQLHITENDAYSIVIKTHWLRIIQRHWKKIYRLRQIILQKRMTIQSLKTFEITADFPYGLRIMPSLYGMLFSYKKQN